MEAPSPRVLDGCQRALACGLDERRENQCAVRRPEERVDRIIELMASTLAEGAAAGEIRKVAPVPAARFLWASLTGAIALNLRPGLIQMSKRDVAEVVREFLKRKNGR